MKTELQNQPLLSVVMITYGHEAFLRQAVESILMQECDFQVELIVADDCSPDNTPAIMQEILETHPRASWIRYIRHEKNKGMTPNFIWAMLEAKGTFIALCEGDDFWTDPHKLQKQVNYLIKKKSTAGCFHHAQLVNENNEVIENEYNSHVGQSNEYDQFRALTWLGSAYATSSLVFRRKVLESLPEWFEKNVCDELLDVLITSYGTLDFLNENMSVYRVNSTGVWSGSSMAKKNIDLLNRAAGLYKEPFFRKKYHAFLSKRISRLAQFLALDKSLPRKTRISYFFTALKHIHYTKPGTYLFVLRFALNPFYK